ncbi:MAG: hypothetical protein LM590_14660 [Thermofilum sp.]|nr:hypothetical protein [Thermofilum sp.]
MKVRYISLDMDGTIVSRKYVDYFWLELVPGLYAERHGVARASSVDKRGKIVNVDRLVVCL